MTATEIRDDLDRSGSRNTSWTTWAVQTIEAEQCRSADTHLLRLPFPWDDHIDIYLKDESTHPTGSLKHRLARSLFLYALCNGWIDDRTTIIEASSGSTAISEAYFARLIGLPFVAVVPAGTSPEKIRLIEREGGRCHLVDDPATVYDESGRLADEIGGHYLDQFTYAERATDWRGNNNIAQSIFDQLRREQHPVPTWIVTGAGTGGTSATIGRYIRYRGLDTKLCVVDPENSAFFPAWASHDLLCRTEQGSRIEGIGRQRCEPSFVPTVVDRMIRVPDAASVAAARFLDELTDLNVGGSTGTNLYGVALLVTEMLERGEQGSIVTLLCDRGDRYATTYFDDDWIRDHGLDLEPHLDLLRQLFSL